MKMMLFIGKSHGKIPWENPILPGFWRLRGLGDPTGPTKSVASGRLRQRDKKRINLGDRFWNHPEILGKFYGFLWYEVLDGIFGVQLRSLGNSEDESEINPLIGVFSMGRSYVF